jgi:HEAT repeat protein
LQDQTGQYARLLAAQALGEFGGQAQAAAPALRLALRDPEPQVRVNAAYALWQVDQTAEAAVPVLSAALGEADWGSGGAARQRAVMRLGQIASDAKAAFPALLELWKDGRNPEV